MSDSNPTSQTTGPRKNPPREFLLADPEEAPRKARVRRRLAIIMIAALVTVGAVTGTRVLAAHWALTRSYDEWMRQDLRSLTNVQREFHAQNGTYGTTEDLGTRFMPSQGVHIEIREVGPDTWSATAIHVRSRTACVISIGATTENGPRVEPVCGRP